MSMVKRLQSKKLTSIDDFQPTDPRFQVIGVFNPGAIRFQDDVILLVRVAQAVDQDRPGWLQTPVRRRLENGRIGYEIDTLEISPDDDGDHRKPLLVSGYRRLAFVSHLEMLVLAPDGVTVREVRRLDDLFGCTDYEIYGVEDPRITKIGDCYWITYVGVSDKMGVATCLMSTTDFKQFKRHGVIFSCENKDVVLFPETIRGKYYCFHRPVGSINIRKLAILLASSTDLTAWGDHEYILGATRSWYDGRLGAGTPPIRTAKGWLSLFHGVSYKDKADKTGTYSAGAMLNDLDAPGKLLAVSKDSFFKPEVDYEVDGYVKNVVFPTGWVRDLRDTDVLHVYYGCADTCVAVASFSEREILASLTD